MSRPRFTELRRPASRSGSRSGCRSSIGLGSAGRADISAGPFRSRSFVRRRSPADAKPPSPISEYRAGLADPRIVHWNRMVALVEMIHSVIATVCVAVGIGCK